MGTQEDKVREYLGHVSEVTDRGMVASIVDAWDQIDKIYAEDIDGALEAKSQAVMWILGDLSLRRMFEEWQNAPDGDTSAFNRLRGALVASVLFGEPAARISREYGVDRQTVHRWITAR